MTGKRIEFTWVTGRSSLVVLSWCPLLVGPWAFQTANRLDRLHVRYDLSWQALDGALARRAVVARAVAVDAYGGGPAGKRLAALAGAAERAPRTAREAAENELSAALALVDPGSLPVALVAELADAEARVLLARRFHNDAVRDTLALRERPAVRVLRLGGTAALPTYFEIAERAGRRAEEVGLVNRRTSARVVLLDDEGACCCSAARTRPSTARRPRRCGGSPWAARRRKGRRCPRPRCVNWRRRPGCGSSPPTMIGPVWRRDAVIDFNGSVIRSEEMFFVHRTGGSNPRRRAAPAWNGPTSTATAGAMRQ